MSWERLAAVGTLFALVITATADEPVKKPAAVRVVIRTDAGDIEVELDTAKAPNTVANFLRYVDGRFYAFRDECTHQAYPLSDGMLEGKKLTCIYHGAEFDVETGAALCLPATDAVETYDVKVEGDDIYVLMED